MAWPQNVADLLRRAEEASRIGRIDDALAFGEKALSLAPDHRSVHLVMAVLESRTGRADQAAKRLRGLAESDPEDFEACFRLSVVYRLLGDLSTSLQCAERATRLRPQEAHVYSNLGLSQMSLHQYLDATRSFETAISLAPEIPQNYEQLAKSLQLQGRDQRALQAFRNLHRLTPGSRETLLAHAQTASNLNRTSETCELAQKVLALDPSCPQADLLLAGALLEQGNAEKAAIYIQAALDAEAKNAGAYALLGIQMQALGRMEEANAAFERSIEIEPEQGFAYCALIRNSKVSESDQLLLEKMERMLESSHLSPRGTAFLHYGLGKAYDDLGRYSLAIKQFDAANRIARQLKFGSDPFDSQRLASFVDWNLQTFTSEFFKANLIASNPSTCPIFIVGMMRSGTTLVEQILSSHSKIEGAGERAFWLNHAHETIPVGEAELNGILLSHLSWSYLAELRTLFPHSLHITDKMPGNYRVLGVIASAFPNAKIIHTKRNPVDTCLSIYMTPNRVPNDFAHDSKAIVFAYRQYQRLVRHWSEVLGPERFLTVQYEELVARPKDVTKTILDFCLLPWEDRCLKPEENERTVVTPSVWQVRQPVYTTSSGRWRNYEPWLGNFRELLEPE